jgi:hypothetical protein
MRVEKKEQENGVRVDERHDERGDAVEDETAHGFHTDAQTEYETFIVLSFGLPDSVTRVDCVAQRQQFA